MTTAIIGTGGIGSAIARQLASGDEALQLSSADKESARKLAAAIGGAASIAVDNRAALQGADAVVLALRFSVLRGVVDEIADQLSETSLIVPSNPVGLDVKGEVVRLLPEGQSSGEVVAGWLPPATRFAMAFGTLSADLLESSSHRSPERAVLFYVSEDDLGRNEVERLVRTAGFEPLRIGGIGSRADSRWAATFMILWWALRKHGRWSLGRDCVPTRPGQRTRPDKGILS
jgi:8-hydroxy-5-deazaflavin:NADPH oxidoreductase